MSPAAWSTAFLLSCLACTGIGWRLGIDHMKASQADIDSAVKRTQEAAEQGAAKAIAAKMPAQQKVIERITHETATNTVYAECRHTAGSLRDLNAALTHSEPASGVSVPGVDAP